MKVKTTKRFTDLKEDKVREVDDVFECTKARFEDIERFVVEVKQLKPKTKKK